MYGAYGKFADSDLVVSWGNGNVFVNRIVAVFLAPNVSFYYFIYLAYGLYVAII